MIEIFVGALIVANVVVWSWVLILEIKLRPVIREWEESAKAKGWVKGVPGTYWLRDH